MPSLPSCIALVLPIFFFLFEARGVHSIGYPVNRPNVDWDKNSLKPSRMGNSFWYHGSATYYSSYGSSGACGYPLSVTDNIFHAAVPDPRWSNSLSPGVGNFGGASCGQCFELKCIPRPRYANVQFCIRDSGSIIVRVTDCDVPKEVGPQWPANHFDLNPPAFNSIADPFAGIVNIKFRRVPCVTSGPKWSLQNDSNGFFHDIIVYDVPGVGAIAGLSIKPAGMDWIQCSQAWGGHYWAFGPYSVGADTLVQIVLSEGRGTILVPYVQTT